MKILLIQSCYENFGGYYRSMSIARSLVKNGHNIDFLISSKKNSLVIKKNSEIDNLTIFKLPRLNISQFINGRVLRGILASLLIILKRYNIIHIFESVQFETNIPLVLCRILRKKVVLDIGDEWLDSPTYHNSNSLIKSYIRFCDLRLASKFNFLTVTSDYLANKYRRLGAKNVLKIINGVDLDQFRPMTRNKARENLGIASEDKIILSFGNTYEGGRAYLLLKTFEHIYNSDKSVKLYFNMDPRIFLSDAQVNDGIDEKIFENITVTGYITKDKLAEYLGACDIVLFLTGSRNAEKACFPIRIGTYLNGERVIAIDRTGNEAYNTLEQYDCLLAGDGPRDIAKKIIDFFNNRQSRLALENNVIRAKEELAWDNLIPGLIDFYKQIK